MTATLREMSSQEREWLSDFRSTRPTLLELGLTAVFCAVPAALFAVLIGFLGSLILRMVTDEASGFLAVTVTWVVPIGLFLLLAGWLPVNTYLGSRRLFRGIDADIASGVVEETILTFADARRYREPEHNTYMLFLRTDADRVFVCYDYESAGRERPKICLHPQERLCLIRFPKTGLDKLEWSGRKLEIGRSKELLLHADEWPEPETFCDVPWDELDGYLTTK